MGDKQKKWVGLGLASVLVLSSAIALADENSPLRKKLPRDAQKLEDTERSREFGRMGRPGQALTEEERAEKKAEHLAKLKESLDARVASGELTEEQAAELYAKAEEGKQGMAPGQRLGQALTEEERAEKKAEHLAKLKESLDARVASGELTEEQAAELYAKAEEGKDGMERMKQGERPNPKRGALQPEKGMKRERPQKAAE